MLSRREPVVVDLDVAKKLVVFSLAIGHVECAERHARVVAFYFDAFAVQVIVVGDLEIELHRTAVDRLGFDLECLLDRQQVVGIRRMQRAGGDGEDNRTEHQQ